MLLAPTENAELLQRAAAPGPRNGRGSSDDGALRDLALCMMRSRLLVVVDGDEPRAFPTDHDPILVAFTDDEAAEAWTATRHPAEGVEHAFRVAPAEADGTERPGRETWTRWCDALDASHVLVNPVGPNAFRLTRSLLADARPRRLGGRPSGEPSRFVDLQARAAARRLAAERVAALDAAQRNGDEEDFARLRALRDGSTAIGDGILSARAQLVFGRWRIGHDDPYEGASQFLRGAEGLARYADPYASVDALIEAVAILRDITRLPGGDHLADALLPSAERTIVNLRGDYRVAELDAERAWIVEAGHAG